MWLSLALVMFVVSGVCVIFMFAVLVGLRLLGGLGFLARSEW